MTTNYARGARVEGRVVEILKSLGFEARRVAGSHGVYDVVAVSASHFVLVQCKSTEAKNPSGYEDALRRLAALPAPSNTVKMLAIWQHGKGWYAWLDAQSGRKVSLNNLMSSLNISPKGATKNG